MSTATAGHSNNASATDDVRVVAAPTSSISFPAMGTTVHVVVVGDKPELLNRSRRLVTQLESKWSRFRSDSEISKLNRANGNPCVVSEPTFELLAKAVAAWSASGGAFDPTIEASLRTAGYDRPFDEVKAALGQPPATPSPIQATPSQSPGPSGELDSPPTPAGIWLDRTARLVQLPLGTTLDLGGIAKGATADLVAEQLLTWGAQGCCVNIGGDVRVLGNPPRRTGWIVNLDVPGCQLPSLALRSGAICTSTTRLRTWINSDGNAEHHIRDPLTGRATNSDLESVVVIAERAIQAEVLTKMILIGGSASAIEILRSSNTTGFTISAEGEVIAMEGTRDFIVGN